MGNTLLKIWLLIFIGAYLAIPAQAQYIWAKPALINIDSAGDTFPLPVYMVGTNFFKFISKKEIDSCKVFMANDSANTHNKFKVAKLGGQYRIETDRFAMKLIYAPNAQITFYFKGGATRTMLLPLLLYPPVKMEFTDSTEMPVAISNGIINYGGLLLCRILYDEPYYVAPVWRSTNEYYECALKTFNGMLLKTYRASFCHSAMPPFMIDLQEFKKYDAVYLTFEDTSQKEVDINCYPLADRFHGFTEETAKYSPPALKISLKK